MSIETLKKQIIPILIKHKIKRAGIFGSTAKGKRTKKSDLDLLVELGSNISLLDFIAIKYELENTIKKKVDLVEYSAIKASLRDQILSEEIRIYG